MNETQFEIKKYRDTSNTMHILLLLYATAGIALSCLGGLLKVVTLVVFVVTAILIIYILIQCHISQGFYWFAPFKKRRLEAAAERWLAAVDRIECTGDYGMCCNEETAIQNSKEYCFGSLIMYADAYIADRNKKRGPLR